jgi:two-component system copper resistance phosphate regulon response regulator CusR
MRLLLVEDDADTASELGDGFARSGITLDVALNGLDGRRFVEEQTYDLIILDVMLPGLNGWQLLQLIRQRGATPVLLLTAPDAIEDRLRGLELSADDYLLKPFAFDDLLTRVRKLLRRGPGGDAERFSMADLEIDIGLQRVSRGGQRISMGETEFALLQLLASRHGEVLSHAQIAAQVFNNDPRPVGVAIQRLRAKIDERYLPKLIHDVGDDGYQLALLEDEAFDLR